MGFPPMRDTGNGRWAHPLLEIACVGFAVLGLALPLAYASAPFALYREHLGRTVGDAAAAAPNPALTLVLGILGGSIAGKWAMHFAIVRFALREKKRWARDASLAGLLSWFVVDSVASVLRGATFNVLLVNLAPMLAFGVPLALSWRGADVPDRVEAVPAMLRPARAVMLASAAGIVAGLVIAFAGATRAFAPWFDGYSAAHFAGAAVPSSARDAALVFFGPIGATTVAHFVMVLLVAKHAMTRGEAWAWRWATLSVLLWFVTDSTWGALNGGAFNIALVNLPTLALMLPPLLWVASVQRARGAMT